MPEIGARGFEIAGEFVVIAGEPRAAPGSVFSNENVWRCAGIEFGFYESAGCE